MCNLIHVCAWYQLEGFHSHILFRVPRFASQLFKLLRKYQLIDSDDATIGNVQILIESGDPQTLRGLLCNSSCYTDYRAAAAIPANGFQTPPLITIFPPAKERLELVAADKLTHEAGRGSDYNSVKDTSSVLLDSSFSGNKYCGFMGRIIAF